MEFSLNKSIEVLERTPSVLEALLNDISDEWSKSNEGGDTWSAYDIIGHLVHGEKTDWINRLKIILSDRGNKTFEPFNRFAQFKESKGKTLNQLMVEFKILREQNINTLKSTNITDAMLVKEGIHPALGKVNLKNLLATWVVHDLDHIAQIGRVMAKQYKNETGAWMEYLPVLGLGNKI